MKYFYKVDSDGGYSEGQKRMLQAIHPRVLDAHLADLSRRSSPEARKQLTFLINSHPAATDQHRQKYGAGQLKKSKSWDSMSETERAREHAEIADLLRRSSPKHSAARDMIEQGGHTAEHIASTHGVPIGDVHQMMSEHVERTTPPKQPRSKMTPEEKMQVPAKTKTRFGHGNTVSLNRATKGHGYEVLEHDPSNKLVARHTDVPYTTLDRMMGDAGHSDSLMRIDDSSIPDKKLFWSATVNHAPQSHRDPRTGQTTTWHHETLSPTGDHHKISTGALDKSDEHVFADFLEGLMKNDPISAKEQIQIDTKKEAEVPAEELMVHKNGQWELKKGDVVNFKTKQVVAHTETDPKTGVTEPKPELKAVTGEKAKLPPPPKPKRTIDDAMRSHGQFGGEQFSSDERARKQKQHEDTFKEVKAKMEADRAKSQMPVKPGDPLKKDDSLQKDGLPAPTNTATPLATNSIDAAAQRAAGAAGSAISGAASAVGGALSNFISGGSSGGFGSEIKIPGTKKSEELKMSEGGQWSIEKADGKPSIKSGFFTVDHLNAMDKAPSHQDAKSIAHAAVDSQEGAHPANVAKAKRMIDSSKSTKHLMIGSANFMLSHPSEGLGMGTKKA